MWTKIVVGTVAATLSMSACSGGGKASTQPGDTLRIAANFLPTFIDPAQGIDALFSFAEAPTRVNASGEVVPVLLAELPKKKSDKRWDLTLRPDVKFQNGKAMDAKAFAAAGTRSMKVSAGAKAAIPGARFTATGPLTVSVETAKAAPLLPYYLADPAFSIYDAAAADKAPDGTCGWAGLGAFTAPYEIKTCDVKSMTLTRFTEYWQGKPALKQVLVTHVPDSLARVAAVQSGQADMADSANTPDIRQAVDGKDDIELKLSSVPLTLTRLYFNTSRPLTSDSAVRRAVISALDYTTLAASFSGGTGIAGQGILPSDYPGAATNQVHDSDKARDLLDQAGWTMGDDGLRRKGDRTLSLSLLIYNERPEMKPLSLGVQKQLKELGIKVNIVTQPFSYKMYKTQAWDLALYSDFSVGPNAVPDSYLATYVGTGGSENFGNVEDSRLDQMIEDLVISKESDRAGLLKQIQDYIVVQEAYQAVLIYGKDGALVGPAWKSYVPAEDSYQYAEWDWRTGSKK